MVNFISAISSLLFDLIGNSLVCTLSHGPRVKLAIGHRPPCKLIQSNTATPNRFCSALHCFSNVFDVRCVHLPLGKVIRNHRCPFPNVWWIDGKSIYNRRTKSQSSPMDHRKMEDGWYPNEMASSKIDTPKWSKMQRKVFCPPGRWYTPIVFLAKSLSFA